MDVPVSWASLSGMYAAGVHPAGVYLVGVHPVGVHLMGVHPVRASHRHAFRGRVSHGVPLMACIP
jgi:hypothetical protein